MHVMQGMMASTLALQAQAQTQPAPPAPPQVQAAKLDLGLQARRLADDTWVIEGSNDSFGPANGCNIINTAFIRTGAGVVVVNSGVSRRYGEQQRALIERTVREPVARVVQLNHHPDYFLGNQAWADVPTQALPGSIADMQALGERYSDNLYRLCGDWLQGTVPTPSRESLTPGVQTLGDHRLEWLRLSGHTDDDLVLIDHTTGVAFVGGLVFADRVPTTPHANFANWLHSLDKLEALFHAGYFRWVVPSHGPVHQGLAGIAQTRDWIQWVTQHMRTQAEAGTDLSELLATPAPARFAHWAALPAELHRTFIRWYPEREAQALGSPTSPHKQ
ncbi:MAG: hypothetical protein RI907_485 [Pseudomonadota bacterium]|jgi:quinoprotein relay system zinc metallohydrolase 1